MADDPVNQSPNFVNPAYATPDQIAQQRAYAKFLTENQMPVTGGRGGWAIGLANALSGLMGGVEAHRADVAQRQAQGGATDQMTSLIQMLQSGGASVPQSNTSIPQVSDGSQPRGIRNNNPGNIEDGPFAKSQPGYLGSDGRFAKFAAPEFGQQAASNLLANYGSKGVNTVAGVINKWAPPSDNNPTSAYAAQVAKQLGVDPNQPLPMNDPGVRQKLAAAMFQFENGKPVQMASLGNGVPPQAMPNGPAMPQGGPQNAQIPPQAPQVAQASPQGPQGLDPRLAAQALTNPYMPPAAGKLIGEALTPQFGVIGQDMMGPVHGFINPLNRTVSPATNSQTGTQQGAAGPEIQKAIQSGTSGDEFLAQLPKPMADQVKAMVEGRLPLPGGFALKSPYWQQMMQLAAQTDPGFDAAKWQARVATTKDFSSGKSAQNITAFNTALQHLNTLNDAVDQLGNTRVPLANMAVNEAGKAGLSEDKQKAIAKFETSRQAVVDELTRAFRGSAGNVADIIDWNKKLDVNGSYAQQKQAIKTAVELLHGRIESVGDQYNRGMQMPQPKGSLELLSPKARATVEKLSAIGPEGTTESSSPAPAPATPQIDPAALAEAKRRGLIK